MFFFKSMRARHVQDRIKGDPLDATNAPSQPPRVTKRFTESKAGNVSIIFGLMAIPFISFAGLSIDFAAASREKAKMQTALDAAVLAAAREFQVTGSEADAKAAAALYFLRQTGYNLTVNDVDDGSFVLTVASEEAISTSFMAVLGNKFDTLTVNALSKAQLVREIQDDLIEVALMLDTTGSMGGSKIADLKTAAKDLVKIIVQDGDDNVRVALAPFSRAVNVGSYYEAITGQAPTGSTCVVERQGALQYSGVKPKPGKYFEPYDPTPYGSSYSCKPSSSTIVPLTSDITLLNDEIDDLPASGTTAGHLGTAWAWYLVKKGWRSIFPAGRKASNTLEGVKKIVVLMSDGQYNRSFYPENTSDAQADQICIKMKKPAQGIEVYSVGFNLSVGSQAYNTLKDCASDEAHFFPAGSGDELKAAFRAIAFNIAELRLVE